MKPKKICVFTGSRAEYGILFPLLKLLKSDLEVELQIIASGTHLSQEFGMTIEIIETDGFYVNQKVEMVLSSDSNESICKSMGLGLIGYSAALKNLDPDILLILGDRYETFTVASTALVMQIPVAHIQGGELTIGAIDDAMRHAITKLSMIHFTYTDVYRRRVIQLGESPDRVFNFGSLNTEAGMAISTLSRADFQKKINFDIEDTFFLITYHPVTMEKDTASEQFQAILNAVSRHKNVSIIFTKSNADAGGRKVNLLIDQFVLSNPLKATSFTSMGQLLYFSALKHCALVIGNSSSGILETPIFKKPTVNVGDRQLGRVRAKNVIDCNSDVNSIDTAIKLGLSKEFQSKLSQMSDPFYKPGTTKNIAEVLKKVNYKDKLKKHFFDQ